MNYIKLQLGCLFVMLYVIFIYVKNTANKRIKCNVIYDIMMFVYPWAVVFDGATAWSVNALDVVPNIVNLILHAIFFALMEVTIMLAFIYMIDLTVGLPKKKGKYFRWTALLAPGIIALILSMAFMYQTVFIEGTITNYSMGPSVIIIYSSMIVHFTAILVLVFVKIKALERKKCFGIISLIVIMMALLIVQCIFKEALISALLPTICIIGFYINNEDPSVRRLEIYNGDFIMGFATLVENRDDSTGGHIKRTKGYVQIILDGMKHKAEYSSVVTKDYYKSVLNAAPMHDIGKIATPDEILKKPGKLTPEEFEIMKQHAPKGGEIIHETFSDLDDPYYEKIAYEVARYHHEKWNGKGYPDGLKEENIPLHARIMAIADVFDAVSAKRCYRDALPIETCFKIIEEGRGTDFDPKLTDIFLSKKEEILMLYNSTKEE